MYYLNNTNKYFRSRTLAHTEHSIYKIRKSLKKEEASKLLALILGLSMYDLKGI
jgi:ribosomal protein L35AE/L33A